VAGLFSGGPAYCKSVFLGPTGSGKTRVVEAPAASLLKDSRSVIKIDCAEYRHSHETAKPIGAPPGYLGHRETHALLTQEALNQHHTDRLKICLVLFDEIEKASDALWNLLVGILDKATLTLGDNRKVDFSSAMIFPTSNLGASEMDALLIPRLGFHAPSSENAASKAKLSAQVSRTGLAAAGRKFTPEFINRLDKIVVFNSPGNKELRRIVDLELDVVQERIQTAASSKPFLLDAMDSAREFLPMEGTDVRYGARPLKRAIERLLVQPISNLMASGQIHRGDNVRVTHDEGSPSLQFFRETKALEAWRIAGRAAA
jgi:ATP-dependent Clp protease ATP-binding subunit ClpB